MRGRAAEQRGGGRHVAGHEPHFMRVRARRIDFGGVFHGDARGRARQVIEQLLPRFRIEPDLHLHATRTLRPRSCGVKKILQNAVLLYARGDARLIFSRNKMSGYARITVVRTKSARSSIALGWSTYRPALLQLDPFVPSVDAVVEGRHHLHRDARAVFGRPDTLRSLWRGRCGMRNAICRD